MLREIEKRDQQKVRTREKERERAEKALSFLLLRAARFVRCEVFRDLWETRGQGNEAQIFVHEQSFWCVCVIIVQNVIKIYI